MLPSLTSAMLEGEGIFTSEGMVILIHALSFMALECNFAEYYDFRQVSHENSHKGAVQNLAKLELAVRAKRFRSTKRKEIAVTRGVRIVFVLNNIVSVYR